MFNLALKKRLAEAEARVAELERQPRIIAIDHVSSMLTLTYCTDQSDIHGLTVRTTWDTIIQPLQGMLKRANG